MQFSVIPNILLLYITFNKGRESYCSAGGDTVGVFLNPAYRSAFNLGKGFHGDN